MKRFFDIVLGVFASALFFTSVHVMYAAWSAPTALPTGNNVDAPINVGVGAQGKMGKLGIGTTNPLTPLQVGAGTDTPTRSDGVYIANPNGSAQLDMRDSTSNVEFQLFTHAPAYNGFSGHVFFGTVGAHRLVLRTNDTDRMTVTESGVVGIGTGNPNSKVQIGDGGDGWANGLTLYSNYPTIYFRDTDNRSSMIHVNGNLMYFLRSGSSNDPSSGNNWSAYNGKWPLYLNMENNDAVFGGNINLQGGWIQSANLRQGDCYHRTQNLSNGELRCHEGDYVAGVKEDGDGIDSLYCCNP